MAKDFSKKFYNSKEWQQIRDYILKRDKYLCQLCGNPAEEVHHKERVTPESIDRPETHAGSNLVSLCRDCHCRQHDKDRVQSKDVDEGYYFDNDGNLKRIGPPISK